ncbi:MAG: hypothetical protein Q8P44_09690, partial [Dehalococcoidia bacterium]|nr:hypothetical protein [Dehalococcoidia bacterium]
DKKFSFFDRPGEFQDSDPLGGYDYLYGTKPKKKSYYSYFPGCKHWRQAVPVGKTVVTCSSVNGKAESPEHRWKQAVRDPMEPLPDYGIYMDTLWRDKISPFWTSGAHIKRVSAVRKYPALVVAWPDMGTLTPELLSELVEIALTKMRQGKIIDIGCNAGHGRTGSLLACLIGRKEHLTGDRAILVARERYCKHAVETALQKTAVCDYLERYKGG